MTRTARTRWHPRRNWRCGPRCDLLLLDGGLQFGWRRWMEVVDLSLESGEPPAHADIARFGVRFIGIPVLNAHAVKGCERAGPVGAAPAVEEDGIVGRIIHQL